MRVSSVVFLPTMVAALLSASSSPLPVVRSGFFPTQQFREPVPGSVPGPLHGAVAPPGDKGQQASPKPPLRLDRTIGTDVGPISFSQIGVAAASPSGLLAVVDNGACQIVLLNLKTGGFVRRIGRCGDGPGEFRRPGSIAFRGDSLLVYDVMRRDLVFIDDKGSEKRRWSVTRVPGTPGGATAVQFLEDTTLVIARYVFPQGQAPDESAQTIRDLLVVVDARNGVSMRTLLPVPTQGWRNEYRIMNHTAICSNSADGLHLVAMSMWEFGGAIFRGPSLQESIQFRTPLKWMEPVSTREVAPGVLPGAVAFNVVCSDDGVLLWAARRDLKVPGHVGTEGRMEFRSYEGRLVWTLDFGKADTLFHERPVAAYKDRIIFRANNSGAYPRLVEFLMETPRAP